ncbi:hypothetical protein BGI41_01630 [Methanobrevibacter sp. 87.7]|uniref:hypothetical protein n=1 Tax=Methanobrevibacter sp. 87.7 TaxID=387957 RepID=UPI000B504A72|nr:hypothetical protein [Methanobrevibacter sp. 87.7]OWT33582.1 hypothetical protein BGI41_01630 [Methanobrevibacter sp. 87.7]
MGNYPEIDNYLDLLSKQRELSKNKEENEDELNNIQSEIVLAQSDVIRVVENILMDMGLKKRKFLSDFDVHMKFDAGLMIKFRKVPSMDFKIAFEKKIDNLVSANYCGDAKRAFFMFKY